MKEKTNWVYEPKTINIKRGICYGLTDLMGADGIILFQALFLHLF